MNKKSILLLLSIVFYCIRMYAQTDALFIDSAGRVGVGKNDPKYKLDVNGNVRASDDITADKNLVVKGTIKGVGKTDIDNNLVVTGTINATGKIETNNDLVVKGGIKATGLIETENNIRLNGTHIIYNSKYGVVDWGENGQGDLIFRNVSGSPGSIGQAKDCMIITGDGNLRLSLEKKFFWDWDGRAIAVVSDGDNRVMKFSNSMSTQTRNRRGGFNFTDESGKSALRVVDYKVGIGTDNPLVPLSVTITTGGDQKSYAGRSNHIAWGHGGVHPDEGGRHYGTCSIFAVGDIASNNIIVSTNQSLYSDIRIKKDIHLSSSASDLATLCKIEVVDYKMIDTIADNRNYKKVIAQQIQKVYPLAVSPYSYYLPSVFQPALCVEDKGDNIYKITVAADHHLAVGDLVKLKCDPGNDVIVTVKEISSATQFVAQSETKITAETSVFVYGKETDDLLTVDYSALSMLNVSATQELMKTIELQQQRIASLEHTQEIQQAQNGRLVEESATMKTSFERLEARMNALEAKEDKTVRQVTALK